MFIFYGKRYLLLHSKKLHFLALCSKTILAKKYNYKSFVGLGVTALCYGGVLRFAAMADTALVSDVQDLSLILDGMKDEIHRLHQLYVRK